MWEIKFKFWDAKNKIMYDAENPHFVITGEGEVGQLIFNNNYIEFEGTYYSKHVKPLQYTGLKDKNGTEIYEGDIYLDHDIFGKREDYYWIVVWEDCGFKLKANIEKQYRGERYKENTYAPIGKILGYELKLVGNIYENKELLEGAE